MPDTRRHDRTVRRRTALGVGLCCALLSADLAAQRPGDRGSFRRGPRAAEEKLPPPVPLGEAATVAVAARYKASKHWVQKSVVLLSLNHYWHPKGCVMVLDALRNRDRRLRAYGIETLLRTEKDLLPRIASAELIQELILKQLQIKNPHYRSRVLEALARIAPDASATTRSQWSSWWFKARKTWEPKPWSPPPEAKRTAGGRGRTVVQAFVERAFDLYHSGLDVAIVIDSTGSMQPTIDAARDALGQMVEILDGISPKLRMGLVHYRDLEDMSDGAKLLTPLTKNVKAVREKLGNIVAMGGGDAPERLANGLEIALSRSMRWKKDTNKLVIIIGDAPPQDMAKATKLARDGFENPGSLSKVVHTGPRKKQKPFITSGICVGGYAQRAFREIAKAGGGAYGQINFARPGGGAGAVGRREATGGNATERIVEHILTLSFGARFRREMRAFVRIFYAYRKAGLFK